MVVHNLKSNVGPIYTPFKFRIINRIQFETGRMCIRPRENASRKETSMMVFLFSLCRSDLEGLRRSVELERAIISLVRERDHKAATRV